MERDVAPSGSELECEPATQASCCTSEEEEEELWRPKRKHQRLDQRVWANLQPNVQEDQSEDTMQLAHDNRQISEDSEDGEDSDGDAVGDDDTTEAEPDMIAGPSTYQESFDWAKSVGQCFLASIGERVAAGFAARNIQKIVVTTTYSGMGCAETSINFIKKAIGELLPFGACPPVEFYSAMDNSELCQRALSSLDPGPAHIFGNIYDLVTDPTKAALEKLQKKYITKFKRAVKQKGSNKMALVHAHGRTFMKDACKLLTGVSFRKDKKAWCYKCQKKCRLSPCGSKLEVGTLYMEIGGHTCTPWSNAGQRMSWLDPEAIPMLIWLFWVKAKGVHHLLNECSPGFDDAVFDEVFQGLYSSNPVVFSPLDLGLPSSRRRKYTHCMKKSMGEPSKVWSHKHLRRLAFRQLQAAGTMYFRAPEHKVQEMCAAMAKKRGLVRAKRIRYDAAMSVSSRLRRDGYITRAKERGVFRPMIQRGDIIINLTQNSRHHRLLKPYAPSLMRKSSLYSLKLKRGMHPLEHFCVQGFPLWVGDAEVEILNSLPIEFLESLKDSQVRSLTGNAMHLAAVGTAILFIWCMSPAL